MNNVRCLHRPADDDTALEKQLLYLLRREFAAKVMSHVSNRRRRQSHFTAVAVLFQQLTNSASIVSTTFSINSFRLKSYV